MDRLVNIIWIGPNPLYDKYIPTIRKHLPKGFKLKIWRDYELVPMCNQCEYFKRHYEQGHYAFCSDYARFKVLYLYGGLYFDTDVELLKDIDDLIESGSFVAYEKLSGRVTSGLVVYADKPQMEIFNKICKFFEEKGSEFEYLADGEILRDVLIDECGYEVRDGEQRLKSKEGDDVYVCPGGTFDADPINPEPWARAIHRYAHLWG